MNKAWVGLILVLLMSVKAWGQDTDSLKISTVVNDKWLAQDKAAHLVLSLALTGYGYHLLRYEQDKSRIYSRNASLLITVGLGLSKEAKDASSRSNHFCLKDLAADLLGLAVGALIFTNK